MTCSDDSTQGVRQSPVYDSFTCVTWLALNFLTCMWLDAFIWAQHVMSTAITSTTHSHEWFITCIKISLDKTYNHSYECSTRWVWPSPVTHSFTCVIQSGEDPQNALSCRSFFANEPLIIGLFCGKWPLRIRHPMGLRHPVWLVLEYILHTWYDSSIWVQHATDTAITLRLALLGVVFLSRESFSLRERKTTHKREITWEIWELRQLFLTRKTSL